MQFQGSPETAARSARIEAAGGLPGSSIFADFAGTSATVPPSQLDAALELQAGRLASGGVTEATLRAQVAAAREERSRRIESSPVGRGIERLYACVFAGHPYARPVIGRDADLARLTVADAQAYARRRIEPGHTLLTVVGPFDPATTLESIRRRFGAIPGARTSTPDPAALPPKPVARDAITAATRSRLLLAGWRLPGRTDADAPVTLVLARLLFGSGGAAERRLAGSPIAQVQGDLDQRRDASLLYAATSVPDGADSTDAEQRLVAAFETLAADGVSDGDLERARRQAEAALLFPEQGAHGRAVALASAQLTAGGAAAWDRELAAVRRVTAQDVQRVAGRYLVAAHRSVVWVQPSAETTP
jgi:zinc protease